ncbi:glycoside hydrolase superfamily [Phascolomyces articulosus]|uniref:Alpha-galactosidase n=1 Tax=Phascolomyces articulosus TaxID=60185 RepID=A0AAD5PA92_9FUNG|nr:glycoside hydrolase superfamily [Phascolomyces articulosus]
MFYLYYTIFLLLLYNVLLLYAKADEPIIPSFATTPPMGWNTWNKYGCAIDHHLIQQTADAMVSEGYLAAGYNYLNLDDCWQSNNRTDNGTIVIDPLAFPFGIKPVADYVHSKGLKFGIYSSAGRKTCAGRMASLEYEKNDAKSYSDWGVDYLKYDNCNYDEGVPAPLRFRHMRDALLQTGRDIFFSVCTWGVENTWEWAPEMGHSFRTHDDIYNDWQSIVDILQVHSQVVHLGGPGHWADPDMLEIGNGVLSIDESITHFSIWSAMKAPLILGNSLTNQDPLGKPALRIRHIKEDQDVWGGPLSNNSMVVVIVNYKPYPQNITVDISTELGYADGYARELWTQDEINLVNSSSIITQTLRPHACAMYKLTHGYLIHNLTTSITPSNNPSVTTTMTSNTNKQQGTEIPTIRYEAEGLNNLVQGLARRKGCALCSGGAYVMAIGNVNRPQTGTLIYRNITASLGPGEYTMRINYLDCFSWSTCGDFFTRRWHLRIRVNNGEPYWISLKSKRNPTITSDYSIGIVLDKQENNEIIFDDPNAYGPSIDYIELTPHTPLNQHQYVVQRYQQEGSSNVFELSFWESGDPLATTRLTRVLADFFWELLFIVICCALILRTLLLLYKHRHRLSYYKKL